MSVLPSVFSTKSAPKFEVSLRSVNTRLYSKALALSTAIYCHNTKQLQCNMAWPPNQEAAPPRMIQTVRTTQIEMLTQWLTGATVSHTDEQQEIKNSNDNTSITTTVYGMVVTDLLSITNNTRFKNNLDQHTGKQNQHQTNCKKGSVSKS